MTYYNILRSVLIIPFISYSIPYGYKIPWGINFVDFVGHFLTTKINTMEMLTAHAQHVKLNDLMQVHMQKHEI